MTPPDRTTLTTLQSDLVKPSVANCTDETRVVPPTYASCAPPSGSSGFTAADWTAVVNEILSESYDAGQVLDHFGDLETIRQGVFESESGSLPAIANDLQLAGAAGNTTTFNLQSFFAGAAGIAASIAGAAEGAAELSAGLWVASELISMLPSASPTASSSFQTNYAGLLDKVATARDEMAKALASQTQQVLGDKGLLGLVGQLRSRETWKPDVNGMQSASREAFALNAYQALLPTMYSRYVVTNCIQDPPPPADWSCQDLPSGPYVISSGSTSATWLGPPSDNPCYTYYGPECTYAQIPGTIPDAVANIVWGAVPATCDYKPGNLNTLWTYGCPLGVPIATSIGADSPGWTFPTESGSPVVSLGLGSLRGAVRAAPAAPAAVAAPTSPARQASPAEQKSATPRATCGSMYLPGRLAV